MSRPRYTENLYRRIYTSSNGNLVDARERAAALGFRVVSRDCAAAPNAARAMMLADAQARVAMRLARLDFVTINAVEEFLDRLGA